MSRDNMKRKTSRSRRIPLPFLLAGLLAGVLIISALLSLPEKKAESSPAPLSDILFPGPEEPESTPVPVLEPESVDDVEMESESPIQDQFPGECGRYVNGGAKEVSAGYGITFRFGVEEDTLSDAIYLNPFLIYDYEKNAGEKYGFYVYSSRVSVSASETDAKAADEGINAGEKCLYICGRTYDRVLPCRFVSRSEYGLKWQNNPLFDGQTNTGTVIYFRAVRLSDGFLMGGVRAEIVYDPQKDSYRLGDVSCSDVSATGQLSDSGRSTLIQAGMDFFTTGTKKLSLSFDENAWYSAFEYALVEKTDHVYFPALFDENSSVIRSGKLAGRDIYAVSIPCTGYGFLTVYFCPESQIYGFYSGRIDTGVVVCGYDALCPFTEETLRMNMLPSAYEEMSGTE